MFADMLLIIQHVETFERKTPVFINNMHIFLFCSYNWRAVNMFEGGAICFKIIFFDNEGIVDHIYLVFVLLYSTEFFISLLEPHVRYLHLEWARDKSEMRKPVKLLQWLE